jgi:RNA recognition motif-containing protein
MSEPPAADGKIFVGGLNRDTTAETICAYFGKRFGEVTDSHVPTDPLSGEPIIPLDDPLIELLNPTNPPDVATNVSSHPRNNTPPLHDRLAEHISSL